MRVIILKDSGEVSDYGADIFLDQLKDKKDSVLGLATGSTPLALYKKLMEAFRKGEVSFSDTTTFNLDEYIGLDNLDPNSYQYYMNREFFEHIDIKKSNTFIPPSDSFDPAEACLEFERKIEECGGIDLQLLGVGRNGHIGFNEPSSALSSRTRVTVLSKSSILDNARFFKHSNFQPNLCITMGVGTILDSRKILLLATGHNKAKAIRDCIEGPLSASSPASALQMHASTIVVVDEDAAALLEHRDFYKNVERVNDNFMRQKVKS